MLHPRPMAGVLLLSAAVVACGQWPRQDGEPSPASDQGVGEQLFLEMGCSACHSGPEGGTGPSLTGVFGSEVLLDDGSTETADEAYIRESILSPNARIVAGFPEIMPSYAGRLSEGQIEALVYYASSLGAP